MVPKLGIGLSAQELERQRSIIIDGIDEENSNQPMLKRMSTQRNKIYELLETIGVETYPLATYRLGPKPTGQNPKPRKLKVILPTRGQQRQVLAAAKKLHKLERFKDIFIRPSLTYEQRQLQWKLVQELRERRSKGEKLTIKNWQIVSYTHKDQASGNEEC